MKFSLNFSLNTLFIAMTLVLTGSFAHAAEDLYPCNLEIKKPLVTVVNEDNTGGTFYARAYVEDYSVAANSPLRLRWINVTAPDNGNWASLFTTATEFRYHIQTLQFPKSLAAMGVSYRIGFCYAGPIVSTSGSSGDRSEGSYDLVGVLSSGRDQNSLAYSGIITGSCDLRSTGSQKAARTSTELFPTAIDNDMQFGTVLGNLPTSEIGFEYTINTVSKQVPRFCRIALEVTETSTGVRPAEMDLVQPQMVLQIDKNLR